jgi:hypothetical protein
VDDRRNKPCRLVSNDGEVGEFKVENPHKRSLYFLKIDWCIISDDEKRCDFAVFSDDKMIFVELKKIKEGTRATFYDREKCKEVPKADYKFEVAVGQLKNTLDIFRRKNIDLSVYQQNQKLFVIIGILDLNPPVTMMPATESPDQDAKLIFDQYDAELLTGHCYQFS